jgi:hypothetical protein
MSYREIPEFLKGKKMADTPQHVDVEKPKSVTLQMFLGKPVIIEPLELADKQPQWKTAPWRALVWADDGDGYESYEMLIFAKAIITGLEKASKNGGWLGGIVQKEGSQLWIDSGNAMIMTMLTEEYSKISGTQSN